MNIQLTNTKVVSLDFDTSDAFEEDSFSLSFVNGYTEDESLIFLVNFEIKIESENGYKIALNYQAEFLADEKINDGFKESDFPIVNAPAIAYPYMRSFVGNLTLQSGYNPVILPTVNFQALAKKST